jgi:hypothetical protein
MNTIVRNVKLPRTKERLLSSTKTQRRKTRDAVSPTVKGLQGVKPSVLGLAAEAKYKRFTQHALVVGDALRAIQTIRDSAEIAEMEPELAALANDPEIIKLCMTFIAVLNKKVAVMAGASGSKDATRNRVAGGEQEQEERNRQIAKEEGLPGYDGRGAVTVDGLNQEQNRALRARIGETVKVLVDSADPAYWSHEQIRLREESQRKMSAISTAISTAISVGDAQDKARVSFGREPRAWDGDDVNRFIDSFTK